MAAASASTDAPTSEPKFNLRNPMPLSATQEQQVKQLYYKRVRGYCAPEIKGKTKKAHFREVFSDESFYLWN
jgi:COX assembly protein 1